MPLLRHLVILAALAAPAAAHAETADAELAMTYADALSSASGEVVLRKLIEFAPASTRVYSADRELLQRLAQSWIAGGQATTITVHGYSSSLDLALAERRANRIRGHLVKYGVQPHRVIAVGHTLAKDGHRIDLTIGNERPFSASRAQH